MPLRDSAPLRFSVLALVVLSAALCFAQTNSSVQAAVPNLIRFSGVLLNDNHAPRAGTVGVTFALYSNQIGGAPLWLETQSVSVDAVGHYSVLLGVTKAEGLPTDLFASGNARWLGVKVEGQDEQPRVLLVSVPYALKAGDAETLGGKPLSAFLLTPTSSGTTVPAQATSSPLIAAGPIPTNGNNGTVGANYIPMFSDSAGDLTNSLVYQSAAGVVGVNTSNPSGQSNAKLHVNGNILLYGQTTHQVQMIGTASAGRLGEDSIGFFFASDTAGRSVRFLTTPSGGSLTTQMSILSTGNVGIGTTTANNKLTVAGTVQSTSGGFMFPDGSLMTSANMLSGSTSTQILQVTQNQPGAGSLSVSGIPSGIVGTTTTNSGYAAGVFGSAASPLAAGVTGMNTSNCTGPVTSCLAQGVFGWSVQASTGVGVWGEADAASSSTNVGVYGQSAGDGGTGVFGYANNSTTGDGTGVYGVSIAPSGTGVWGNATAATGATVGVYGTVTSTGGVAGQFDAPTGGNILIGRSGTSSFNNVFRVDSTGKGYFDNGTINTGADFAESVDAIGGVAKYEPGDVMMIDRSGNRRLALAMGAYSTRVAGIYSTKPGVLATPHATDDPRLAEEVPLAIVGIVPCKVTAENGAIHSGDLLVTSHRPGYAMKGTERRRMLGAVVGKALGSLEQGTGTIEVLVSLH